MMKINEFVVGLVIRQRTSLLIMFNLRIIKLSCESRVLLHRL